MSEPVRSFSDDLLRRFAQELTRNGGNASQAARGALDPPPRTRPASWIAGLRLKRAVQAHPSFSAWANEINIPRVQPQGSLHTETAPREFHTPEEWRRIESARKLGVDPAEITPLPQGHLPDWFAKQSRLISGKGHPPVFFSKCERLEHQKRMAAINRKSRYLWTWLETQ